jgi:flagellar motor switch/type III secretory pathway protein FliN
LQQAEVALKEVEDSLRGPKVQKYRLEELIGEGGPPEKVSMDLLRDVTLDLKIELGRTRTKFCSFAKDRLLPWIN